MSIEQPNALTTAQAAQFLGVAKPTVLAWRLYGGGPSYVKLGKSVRYLRADLDAFLQARRVSR